MVRGCSRRLLPLSPKPLLLSLVRYEVVWFRLRIICRGSEFYTFIGFASGFSSVLVPIYLGELAPPSRRSTLGTLTQFSLVTGIFISALATFPFATESRCRILFAISPVTAIAQLFCAPWLLESPSWLLNNPSSKKARFNPTSRSSAQEINAGSSLDDGEIAQEDFLPLKCNEDIEMYKLEECKSWVNASYDFEDKVKIPCGMCVVFDKPPDSYIVLEGGLSVRRRLVYPPIPRLRLRPPSSSLKDY